MRSNPLNRLSIRLSLLLLAVIALTAIALAVTSFLVVRTAWEIGSSELDNVSPRDFVFSLLFGPNSELALPYRPLVTLARALLWIALIGGGIGAFAGISISRRISAPLDELAAARAIGSRNLARRVTMQGTDEIVEVAGAFNQMAQKLESTEGQRQQLLADIAHELCTPLTVIQGNLRAILDDVYPLNKEEVARLYDQTRQLTRLVNDLQELAQVDTNQLTLNVQPVDVNDVVQDATERFEPLAKNAGIRLETRAGAHLPLISIDPMRMLQVLDNLLANALRHTPAGGTIRVCTRREEDTVVLEVLDSGEGIDAEDLPHLFDRFYRTDRSRNRDTGGSGLGLAITRSLVEAQGGRVSAHSAGRGQGSTFCVHLPITPA